MSDPGTLSNQPKIPKDTEDTTAGHQGGSDAHVCGMGCSHPLQGTRTEGMTSHPGFPAGSVEFLLDVLLKYHRDPTHGPVFRAWGRVCDRSALGQAGRPASAVLHACSNPGPAAGRGSPWPGQAQHCRDISLLCHHCGAEPRQPLRGRRQRGVCCQANCKKQTPRQICL